MLWLPTDRVAGVREAWPVLSTGTVPLGKAMPPSLNVTVPEGTPVEGATGVMVAVNVTAWPYTHGFTQEASAAELLAWLTIATPGFKRRVMTLVSPPSRPLLI